MMREIEFKFWQKEDKEMSEPMTLEDGFTGGQPSAYCFLERDCVALQYTGLTDKNGAKIYEGDILNYKVHEDINNWASPRVFKPKHAFVVEFKNGSFVNDCEQSISEWINNIVTKKVEHEVIGNIHQHPELMKGE